MSEKTTLDPADVKEFIVETFLFGNDAGLQDDTSFMDSGLIDSMGILQVVEFIEKTCGIKIKEDQLVPENLDSIDRIVRFINRDVALQAPRVNAETSRSTGT